MHARSSLLTLLTLGALAAGAALLGNVESPAAHGAQAGTPVTTTAHVPADSTTTSPTTSATTSPPTTVVPARQISVLFTSFSPELGLVTTTLSGPRPSLFVTHDFVHFTQLPMPVPPTSTNVSGGGGIVDASFPTDTDGWVAGGDSGSNAPITFSRTTDGGRTWVPLGGVSEALAFTALLVFVNATVGFGTRTLSLDSSSTLEVTTDGGATWSPEPVPVGTASVYSIRPPAFSGTTGVLPVSVAPGKTAEGTFESPGSISVDFDLTTDGGATWVAGPSLVTTATTEPDESHLDNGPSVSIANADDWWVVSPGPSGALTVSVTTDGGAHWSSTVGEGLPAAFLTPMGYHGVGLTLDAISGEVAVASVGLTTGSAPVPYVTTDGGLQWSRLTVTTGR